MANGDEGRRTPDNTIFRDDSRLESDRARARLRAGQPSRNPHLGIASVVNVNYEEFFVTLKILIGDDQENIRAPVPLSMPGGGARHFFGAMPTVGDHCVVGWMPQETLGTGTRDTEGTKIPVILAWVLPGAWLGHDWVITAPFEEEEMPMSPTRQGMVEGNFRRVRHKRMHLRPGDVAASSGKGSDILLNEGVYISNRRANEIRLREQDQAFVVRSQQQFHVMSGVRTYGGMVQRDAGLAQFSVLGADPRDTTLGFDPVRTVTDLSDDGAFVRLDAWQGGSEGGGAGGSEKWPAFATNTPLLSGSSPGGTAGTVYGGKRFLRLSESGANVAATTSSAMAEYRVEVNYTTKQILPMSEQTEQSGEAAYRVPGVEFVMGNVVGNNPQAVGYGLPMRPVIFSGGKAAAKQHYESWNPQHRGRDELAASLFHVNTVGEDREAFGGNTWWSVTKGGAFKAYIGGRGGTDTIQVLTPGGIHIDGKHLKIGSEGPISLTNRSFTDARNVGIGWKSSGAITIEAEGNIEGVEKDVELSQPQGQSEGEDVPTPSIILKGDHVKTEATHATVAARDKVDLTAEVTHISGGSQLVLKADAGQVNLSATEYHEAVMGRKVRKYSGAAQDSPAKLPFRETTFVAGGPVSQGAVLMQDVDTTEYAMGSRHEEFTTGGHTSYYNIGTTTFKHNAGGFEAYAGGASESGPYSNSLTLTTTGGFEAKVTVGKVSMTTSVGEAEVSSKTRTTISALVGGVNISSKTVITLSSPGTIATGGVVCGLDLHPLIGQPLSSIGCGLMGSKTISVTV